MPIRLCISSSSYVLGGLERLLLDLVRGLDPERFEVTLCLLAARGRFPEIATSQLGAERARIFDLSRPTRLRSVLELARFLRTVQPHIVHAFGLKGEILARLLHPSLGRPALASTVANPDLPFAFWKRLLARLGGGGVAAYWADCHARAARGVERLSLSAEKIRVIYPGVPLPNASAEAEGQGDALRAELGVAPGTPVLLAVGDLRRIKGHHLLVAAAPAVLRRFPDARFVLVGDDAGAGTIRALAEGQGLGDRMLFAGFQPDVRPWLRAADLLLQPSLSEGLPRAILEAMAAGLPVLATQVGGIPEVIAHGVNGHLIPPGDAAALARGVITLLDDPQLRARLAREGRRTVEQRFTLDRMLADFTGFYHRLRG